MIIRPRRQLHWRVAVAAAAAVAALAFDVDESTLVDSLVFDKPTCPEILE